MLVVAESLGSAPYYRAPRERVAVHPMRRLLLPTVLSGYAPEHVLFGHGEGIHERAGDAVRDAIAGARRRTPAWLGARARELARR